MNAQADIQKVGFAKIAAQFLGASALVICMDGCTRWHAAPGSTYGWSGCRCYFQSSSAFLWE